MYDETPESGLKSGKMMGNTMISNVRLTKNDKGFSINYDCKKKREGYRGDGTPFDDYSYEYKTESFGESDSKAAFDRFLSLTSGKSEIKT